MGYDPKCEELARHFLPDAPVPSEDIQNLAQTIQDAIEDWLQPYPEEPC
jgi:lauroyl/myristoyl acyltransferase